MRHLRNILLLTAVVLTACEKKAGLELDSAPIGFGIAATKADPEPIDMPDGTFTAVGKFCSGSTWNASTASDVFATTLQNITTDGTSACTYTPIRYWKSNSTYRFRAVSPIAPDQVNYTDDLNGNATITNFTVSASAASQKDLMLSELAEVTKDASIGTPSPVALTFHHLLCKVIIQIGEETNTSLAPNASLDEFTITGVRLNGLPKQGTYTYTGTTSDTWNASSGTWSLGGSENLTCINNTSYTLASDGAFTTVFDGLLLIPMTINNTVNGVNMVVSYTVSHDDGDPDTDPEVSTPTVSIPIPPITWEAGKVYTYQLKMSEEYYIRFGNITVDTWGSPQSSGTVIIK